MIGNKKRILLIGEAATLAHVGRVLSLAEALAPYPVECHVAFDRRHERYVPDKSRFHHFSSIAPEIFMERVNSYKFPYTEDELERYVLEDLRILEELRPDVVIGDFRITLAISARKLKIPYLSITNGYWLPECGIPLILPDHGAIRYLPPILARPAFKILRPFFYRIESAPFNRVAERFDVKEAQGSLMKVYTQADHRLLVEPEGWLKAGAMKDATFIGPVAWYPSRAKPVWWQDVDWSYPTVYLGIGSSGSTALVGQVLEALEGLNVQVIVSGVEKSPIEHSKNKIYCAPFIPNSDVLEKAQIFISNGGSLSMVDAFRLGKPVIGIAVNYEQILSASIIKLNGVGEGFIQRTLKMDDLRRAVEYYLSSPAKVKQELEKVKNLFSQEMAHQRIWQVIQNLET